jgi:Ser/Thr protein kinase RdoA (MazF antagonist)
MGSPSRIAPGSIESPERQRRDSSNWSFELVVVHCTTMQNRTQLMSLCRRWCAAGPVSVAPLGTPGFSGSQVFVVDLPESPGRFVLKSFHAAASREHAAFVHELVRHLRAESSTQLAEVMLNIDGDTIVMDAEGRLWELCRFMPGVPVPSPTPSQTAAATTALARLHLAAASLPGHSPRAGISPGVERRIDQARQLLTRPWQARRDAWSRAACDRMPVEVAVALDARVAAAIDIWSDCGGDSFIARARGMRPYGYVLQAVLRDIWSDHVLFADERSDSVTAIIDLHAAGIDTPATDLARLMGSWDSPAEREHLSLMDRWQEAIAAYERVRPLSGEEAELIPFLHGTGVVFGLDNWFRWTLEEQRVFPDALRMLDRIDRLLKQLPGVIATA